MPGTHAKPGPDPPPVEPLLRPVSASRHTPAEELANVLTHALGLLLAVVGGIAGVAAALAYGGMAAPLTVGVYCLTLVSVYLTSTFFHAARRPRVKNVWRTLDHVAIYGLIAGTYTPLLVLAVGGAWGWSLFGAVWAMAVAGVISKTLLAGRFDRFEKLDVFLYVAMGWLGVVGAVPVFEALPGSGLAWLVAGGLAYTGGGAFYLWDRLPYNHAIWHGFVLAGSVCHYIMITWFVLPGA